MTTISPPHPSPRSPPPPPSPPSLFSSNLRLPFCQVRHCMDQVSLSDRPCTTGLARNPLGTGAEAADRYEVEIEAQSRVLIGRPHARPAAQAIRLVIIVFGSFQ
jgi:hypothetical protein